MCMLGYINRIVCVLFSSYMYFDTYVFIFLIISNFVYFVSIQFHMYVYMCVCILI